MGVKVKMNPNWERNLNRIVHGAVKNIANDYQQMLDRISRRYKGRPVPEIKSALGREWSRLGGTISDAELTRYAQLISKGTRIKMQVIR